MTAYSASVLLGALLLFFLQPATGRLLLPRHGGGAAVWTACLVFFQAGLFGGYAYAHALGRLPVARQVALHLGLLGLGAALFLLAGAPGDPAPGADPVLAVWAELLWRVGPPYVLLAATAPTVQRWLELARPDRPAYRLYAWSNLGSFGALLLYPTVAERFLTRAQEALLLRAGYVVFVGLLVVAALDARRRAGGARAPDAGAGEAVGRWRRLAWWGLPALSSALLVAVSQALAANVPPMPFLWVLPLGLYLLSYAAAFRFGDVLASPVAALVAGAAALVPLASFADETTHAFGLRVLVLNGALLVAALYLHGLLYRLRPRTSAGSSFYLALAGGGALGGLVVALGAPRVLDTVAELPVLLLAVPLLAALRLVALLPAAFARPLVAVLVLGWLAALPALLGRSEDPTLVVRERNAYGVHAVHELARDTPLHHRLELVSGSIVHGIQYLRPEARRVPTTYYTPGSGVGLALRAFPEDRALSIGVVGLGAGTLAAYGKAGDRLRFYELDPKVVEVARDPFTFLADSPAEVEIVPGDARLSLAAEPARGFDLLALDAFVGDAIPVHLLTREAFVTYLRHLAPGGVLAVHVSSRYFDLVRVLARIAEELDLAGVRIHRQTDEDLARYDSTWVLLARDPGFFQRPGVADHARALADFARPTSLWTDERAPLLEVISWSGS